MTILERERLFVAACERLSELGHCDSVGGAECRRVHAEWVEAGRPEIEPFIRQRANWDPGRDN